MSRRQGPTLAVLASALIGFLGGCAQAPLGFQPQATPKPAAVPASSLLKRPGGFYTDDGPDGAIPVDLERLPEPQPKLEPMNAQANQPYSVFGREYIPLTAPAEYRRQGTASWYGRKFHGQRTSSGEVYDMYALTAAHPTLPIPSYARIHNLQNGKSVVVRINDRGPFSSGRIMDVSYAAAHRLGFLQEALANVEVLAIVPEGVAPRLATAPAATNESPAETPPDIPIASESGGIYLQLGAFSNRANAENFRARASRELEWLKHPFQLRQRGNLVALQVGPFAQRAEANATAQKIRESLAVKPLVISR
jgi:rare lipoprotein A